MPPEKTPQNRRTAGNTKVREVTGLPFRLTLNLFTEDASNHRFQLSLPIRRRKGDAPKARRGVAELDAHFGGTVGLLLNGDDAALLLFAAEGVLQDNFLICRYAGGEADQRAMGVQRQV